MGGRKKSKAKTPSGYKKKQTQVGFNSGQQNFVDRQNEETNKVAKDEEKEKVTVATPPPKEETTTETPPREEVLTTPPPSKLKGDHASIVGGRDSNNNKSSPKECLVTEEVTKTPVMDVTPPASKPPTLEPPTIKTPKSVESPAASSPHPLMSYPKHPLEYSWTFWYWNSQKSKTWEDCLIKLGDFSYAEDFWAIVNHTTNAKVGSDFMVFKKGVEPMWEDPANKEGGRWLIKMGVNERHDERSHKSWVELLMMMIGNTVDCERVTGAVFNSRGQCDKMSVWLKTISDKDYIMNIGYAFRSVVNGVFDMGLNLKFEAHEATQTKRGKDAPFMYEIRIESAHGGGGRHYVYNSRPSFRAGV